MKKIIPLLAIACMVLFAVSCADRTKKDTAKTIEEAEETVEEKAEQIRETDSIREKTLEIKGNADSLDRKL